MRLKQIFILTALSVLFFTSCKKDTKCVPDTGDKTRADLTRDSIFYYAKEIYLWNTALPTYEAFNPRSYSSSTKDIDNYGAELIGLAKSAVNPATGKGYEMNAANTDTKYSYITDIADKNPVAFVPNKTSSVDLEGNGNDFGIRIIPYGNGNTPSNEDDFFLYISAVYPGSPADKAGLMRSFRITKIDGVAIGTNWSTERTGIYNKLDGSKIILEGTKYVNDEPAGSFSATLNKVAYTSSPVLATNVFTYGAKKIGYLAFARFSKLSNSTPDIDAAFANFSTSGVTDLIIDLRYNGGGYINTAEYLINQIAPSSLNGKVMYSEHYNALMQSGKATILTNQPFLDGNGKVQYQNGKMITYADVDYSVARNTELFKKGSFPLKNVTNVVFIVMGGTASASELVINSLKAYPSDINVKLVGTKTFGKPVGFFPIRLENKYDVYYSLFHTKNFLNEGDYFNGFTPDIVDGYDDAGFNFGDAGENLIAKAIGVLNGSATRASSSAKIMSIDGKAVNKAKLIPMKAIGGDEFVGMIETNHKIKK